MKRTNKKRLLHLTIVAGLVLVCLSLGSVAGAAQAQCVQEIEPNGTMLDANDLGRIPFWGSRCVTGRIAGWKDFFMFVVEVGSEAIISTTSRENGDTVLKVLDAAGNQLYYNDDDPAGGLQSRIDTGYLTPGALYFVVVEGFDKSAQFDYLMAISTSPSIDPDGIPLPTPPGL